MQVVFESSDPQRALEEGPSEIGLFQHGGGEKAEWTDGKVEKDGTHPVVYPVAGSHATFYEAAVYVENGRKGSGVGCDDTSAPLRRLVVEPIQVPTDPGSRSPYAWLDYEGRWGEWEQSFNNGPTGPNTKDRWTAPMTWMEEIRSTSPRLPAGSVLGPTVTKTFCGTVAEVTSFLNHTQDSPWVLLLVPIALLLLIALIAWRTRWLPLDLGNLRRGRAFGQLLFASAGLYWRHWRTFALIGVTAIPIVGGFNALTWLLTGDSGRRLDEEVGLSGLHVALGVILMALTVVGLPFAAWKYVGWLFIQQQISLRTSRCVRRSGAARNWSVAAGGTPCGLPPSSG